MHPLTDKWYGEADSYQPQRGKEYSWVWDYARFRFEWACEKGRYIEEKAITLFKLLLSISLGVGAVFSFLVSHKVALSLAAFISAAVAIGLLVGSGLSLMAAFNPADHLYPIEEQAALECIDRNSADQDSRANLSLTLTASTEFERQATNRKARWLQIAIGSACLALLLFIVSLFCEVHP